MIETLSIRAIEEQASTVYEAIIVLAKRARQINAEQKQQLMREKEFDEDYDVFVEDDVAEVLDIEYEKLPKPSRLALNELLDGKMKFEYRTGEDGEKESDN